LAGSCKLDEGSGSGRDGHALKIYNWINERGGKAIFAAIEKPQES